MGNPHAGYRLLMAMTIHSKNEALALMRADTNREFMDSKANVYCFTHNSLASWDSRIESWCPVLESDLGDLLVEVEKSR